MKPFKTVAIKTSEKPLHVHATMFIKGREYIIQKHPNPSLSEKNVWYVEGYFGNKQGGIEWKGQGFDYEVIKEHLQLRKTKVKTTKLMAKLIMKAKTDSPDPDYAYDHQTFHPGCKIAVLIDKLYDGRTYYTYGKIYNDRLYYYCCMTDGDNKLYGNTGLLTSEEEEALIKQLNS